MTRLAYLLTLYKILVIGGDVDRLARDTEGELLLAHPSYIPVLLWEPLFFLFYI